MHIPMSLRWTAYIAVSPPEGNSKTQNGHFSSKSTLLSKEVYYKVSLSENRKQQSCKAFIGLSIHAKIVDETETETDPPHQKRRFKINIRL